MQNATNNKRPAATVPARRFAGLILFLSLLSITTLSGCGGGADSQSKPPPPKDKAPLYTGVLLSDDIKAFKQELWEKLSPLSVCGNCHNSEADPASRQTPYFADWADVNAAYNEVVNGKLVDLTNPADSLLVKRVASGHQCWLGSTSLCESEMIKYIEAWANSSKKGETNVLLQINPLNPSQIKDPGQGLFFPVDAPTSYTAFHNLVTNTSTANCIQCHSSTAKSAITPYFADINPSTSYSAVKTVMDINNPAESRIIKRLTEKHNCWTDCPSDVDTMMGLINSIRAEILASGELPFDLETDAVSKALTMIEGNIASSGNRYESSQIALYEFKSGSINPNSTTIYDTSGVAPALDLTLFGTGHEWKSNWGIEFTGTSRALASVENSHKLYDLIRLTGEYSIEAWVIPANITQENATIIAYSGGAAQRNFAVGQTMYNYDVYQRSSTLGIDGQPKLMTNDDDQDLQATLQHVVVTYDMNGGRRIYVNGEFTDDEDTTEAGNLLNWHPSYVLSFGNELSNDRPWSGILRMVAIHDRALTEDQIRQNYSAEVGQKYMVPFSVSHLLNDGIPHSYVVFEVSKFDDYSYLFRNPRFINVDPDSPDYIPSGKALRSIRIGMNGQDISVGQAYTSVSVDNLAEGYSHEKGLLLSDIDTVIEIQNGDSDEFFLTFGQLGDRFYNFTESDQTNIPPLPTVPADIKPADIGIRTFEEINASMAHMTGISNWQNVTNINQVFTTYKQQLPAVENIETFLSSHQMAIAQLAMSYCDERVKLDAAVAPASPDRYFTDFDFTLKASEAFNNNTKVKQVVDPLLLRMLNVQNLDIDGDPNLATQPAVSAIRQEIDKLINEGEIFPPPELPRIAMTKAACMTDVLPENNCDNTVRTQQIVKASCAAVLGSAAMLVQ